MRKIPNKLYKLAFEFLVQPDEIYHPKFITYNEYITVLIILLKTCNPDKEILQDKDFLNYCRNSFKVKAKAVENVEGDVEKNWDSIQVSDSFHELVFNKLNSTASQFFTFGFFKHLVYQGVQICLLRYKDPYVEKGQVDTLFEIIFYKDYNFVRAKFLECKLFDGQVFFVFNEENVMQFEFCKRIDVLLEKELDDYRKWAI